MSYIRDDFRIGNVLPHDPHRKQYFLLRLFLGITFILGILALFDQRQYADEIAVWAVSPSWRWSLRVGGLLVAAVGVLLLSTWTSLQTQWLALLTRAGRLTARLGALSLVLTMAIAVSLPVLVLSQYGRFVLPFFTRLLIFWILVSIGTWLTHRYHTGDHLFFGFAATALIYGAAHRLVVFRTDLSAYPFSLGWSEASRYYFASLFLSERIYGIFIPPSILHPTRYLMQSLPFLIPGAGIIVHRIWQVLIWVILSALVGKLLANRLSLKDPWVQVVFSLWTFLFLFQGPVYYHLLVMVLIILWGTRTTRPWWTLAMVSIASIWAGISRVNWIPVPGILAALLYFLEQIKGKKSFLRYLQWPMIWFSVGSALGLASQFLYIAVSRIDPTISGSSFTSQLLWYRLLPSATYALGVLPAIVFASLPLLLLITYHLRHESYKINKLRILGLISILVVLFLGGILVSVKIGGGSNLHNMDAFLVALLIAGVYTATGRWTPEFSDTAPKLAIHPLLLMSVIFMPLFFVLGTGRPLRVFETTQAQKSLVTIQSMVDPINAQDGDVLFITQRHLLTLGQISGVKLIPDYETVFLMEMAMSRNRTYLNQFHADLESHHFDLIVVDNLSTQIQGRDHNFSEENNAWVEEVSIPLLCHYDVIESLSLPPLQFLVPSEESRSCSN